jgi:glycosyltransferase involved in cell wall biosynthesis
MTQCTPEISVIVRTAGRAEIFLERTLRSIRGQTRAPAEVIISLEAVDQSKIKHALSALGSIKVLIVPHASRTNAAAAANRALAHVNGAWITFLDDDDTWHPSFIEEISGAISRLSDRTEIAGFVTQTLAVYERFDGAQLIRKGSELFNPDLKVINVAALAAENRFTNNAFVFARKALDTVGPFDESLRALEDWEFNVRFAQHFDFEVIPIALANYHQRREGERDTNSNRALMIAEMTRIRNSWIRADVAAGRFGIGYLSLLGEVRGLGSRQSWLSRVKRALNRICRRWRRV